MSRCQDLEPLFASYVDGEAAPPERASVDAHLDACAPCRERIAAERAARDVLRARGTRLRPCASQTLRSRCAAHRAASGVRGGLLTRRAWVPLSIAAAVLLTVSGAFFLLGNSVEVLAAQLAVDHMTCFQFVADRGPIDPLAAGHKWETGQGWALKVPASAAAEQLELLGVRRCLSSEGRVAHLMYRWRGEPLSVFVLNSRVDGTRATDAGSIVEESVEKMGKQAVIWSRGDRTYAVVTRGSPTEVQQVARYVRRAAE